MQEHIAYSAYSAIYNTFGKNVPSQQSGQFRILQQNTEQIPDECAKYICQRATELDNLPANMTKFYRACFESWKSDNPNRLFYESCPTCNGAGGWTFFRQIDGKVAELFSPCPSCTWIPARLREKIKPLCKTPSQLKNEGAMVMPHNYPGGVLMFRKDKHIDALPEEKAQYPASSEAAKTLWEQRHNAIRRGEHKLNEQPRTYDSKYQYDEAEPF